MKQYYIKEYQDSVHTKVIVIPIFTDNYVYILTDDSKNAFIVDPGVGQPVCDIIKSLDLNPLFILITHSHHDHIGGVPDVVAEFPNIKKVDFSNCSQETNYFKLADRAFDVFKTPGHLNDHICFSERKQKILFCGDVLFRFGCGRIFVGSYEELFRSMKILRTLPLDTDIYCTHEYTAQNLAFCVANGLVDTNEFSDIEMKELSQIPTLPVKLGFELKYNPFLKADSLIEFTKWRQLRNEFR